MKDNNKQHTGKQRTNKATRTYCLQRPRASAATPFASSELRMTLIREDRDRECAANEETPYDGIAILGPNTRRSPLRISCPRNPMPTIRTQPDGCIRTQRDGSTRVNTVPLTPLPAKPAFARSGKRDSFRLSMRENNGYSCDVELLLRSSACGYLAPPFQAKAASPLLATTTPFAAAAAAGRITDWCRLTPNPMPLWDQQLLSPPPLNRSTGELLGSVSQTTLPSSIFLPDDF